MCPQRVDVGSTDHHRPCSERECPEHVTASPDATVEKNHPNTSYAAKAALASAWIHTFALEDTAAGRKAYERVMEQYPETEQARVAKQVLTGEPAEPARPPDVPADSLSLFPTAEVAASGDSTGATGSDTLAVARETAPVVPGGDPFRQKAPPVRQEPETAVVTPEPLTPVIPVPPPAATNPNASVSAPDSAVAVAKHPTNSDTTNIARSTPPVTSPEASPPATTNATEDTAKAASPREAVNEPPVTAQRSPKNSRLAPARATGLPRPLSARKFAPKGADVEPAKGAQEGPTKNAGTEPARKKAKPKRDAGVPPRGSIRPPKDAPADTTQGQGRAPGR